MKQNGLGFTSLPSQPERVKVDMFRRQLDIMRMKLIKMVAREMCLAITIDVCWGYRPGLVLSAEEKR